MRSQGVGAVMRGLYAARAGAMGIQRPEQVPEGVIAHVQRWERMTPDGFLGVARAAGDQEGVLERLPEIAAPTLIITGDSDFLRGPSEEMAKRIAGARFVLINGSFHGTCLWQPDKFTSAVLDFLADVEAGRPVAGREER